MNIVDSSGWLAYFADEPNAGYFLPPLSEPDLLVVPTVTMYEVFKVIMRESGENDALQAVVAMQRGQIVELNIQIAIAASRLSVEYRIPMADSIILATALEFKAVIWTQDSDFENINNVKYFHIK
jgi:predicted nucleic acid-binding protein